MTYSPIQGPQSEIVAVPYLTTDQMREVDRAMIEDYHIELIQMMENAGRNLAHLARMRFLNGDGVVFENGAKHRPLRGGSYTTLGNNSISTTPLESPTRR